MPFTTSLFPSSSFSVTSISVTPLSALEYWSRACSILLQQRYPVEFDSNRKPTGRNRYENVSSRHHHYCFKYSVTFRNYLRLPSNAGLEVLCRRAITGGTFWSRRSGGWGLHSLSNDFDQIRRAVFVNFDQIRPRLIILGGFDHHDDFDQFWLFSTIFNHFDPFWPSFDRFRCNLYSQLTLLWRIMQN